MGSARKSCKSCSVTQSKYETCMPYIDDVAVDIPYNTVDCIDR